MFESVDENRGIGGGAAGEATPSQSTQPSRVLHVTNVETGNYYLNNLVDYTDRREIQHLAVTLGSRGVFVEQLEDRGVKCFAVACSSRRLYLHAARKLREIIQRERIDIIHGHLFEPTLIAIAAAKTLTRPVVVTRHYSDALYRIKQPLKRKVFLSFERWINQNADHVIAPSQMVRDILVKREQVSAEKISLIPYGQTTKRFDDVTPQMIAAARQELQMDGALSIVCVSRLHPEKGHAFLLQAFAQLVRDGLDAKLFLVGLGPLHDQLAESVQRYGLRDRVKFLGWREDALAILAAADLVVHPSLQEALPSAVIESLMLERPLIATDVSGVRDMVGEEEHGLIVPPADAAALRAGIVQTIGDWQAAKLRAKRGRQFVLSYMDAGRVAEKYTACYRNVMRQRELRRGFSRQQNKVAA